MSCTTYFDGDTVIHRLDPRPRILATLLFALLVALAQQYIVLLAALVIGIVAALVTRLPLHPLVKRLARINGFMVLLFLLVPVTSPGPALFELGGLSFSMAGIHLAAQVTLKANAIVLVFTALLGTVAPASLGHAFQHLHVPTKLTHLLLFALRYLDVLHHEYLTLQRAMKTRGFRPRMSLHTYRSYAYLTGMVLVRSLERSERVVAAMRCRGFKGDFIPFSHFTLCRRDLLFGIIATAFLVALACAEWSQ